MSEGTADCWAVDCARSRARPAQAKTPHIQNPSAILRLAVFTASPSAMVSFYEDSLTEILFLSRRLIIIRHSWNVIQTYAIVGEAADGNTTHRHPTRKRRM